MSPLKNLMNFQRGTSLPSMPCALSSLSLSAVPIVRRAPVGSASHIFRSAVSRDVAVATASEAGHVSWRWLTDALAGGFCQSLLLLHQPTANQLSKYMFPHAS